MVDEASYKAGMAEARRLLDNGEIGAAERILTGLAQARPSWPSAFIMLANLATRQRNWSIALERWDTCLARFPDAARPEWRRGRAQALMGLTRFEDAEPELRALSAIMPDDAQTDVGLARCAMHAEDWVGAISLWTRLCERTGADASPDWQASRAKCLSYAGRLEEAVAAYNSILSEHPSHAAASGGLASIFLHTGQKEEAAAHLRKARERSGETSGFRLQASKLAAQSVDMATARRELHGALELADTAEQLNACFWHMPRILEGWELTQTWLDSERRLRTMASQTDSDASRMLAMRLRVALRDYKGFLSLWNSFHPATPSLWTSRFGRLAELLRDAAFPNIMSAKVIGLGLPRTGSTSLHYALEEMGYLAAHYTNTFTGALLTIEDAFLFDALTDSSAAILFEQIYHAFPNSRFIVADRPVESWVSSFERHITRYLGVSNFSDFSQSILRGEYFLPYGALGRLANSTFWRGQPDLLAAREAWRARVDSFIALHDESRFLRFDAFSGDGWEKLCGFLNKPIPPKPFPHDNRADRINLR